MAPRQRIEKLLTPDDKQSLYFNTFCGLSIAYIQEWLSYNHEMVNELFKHLQSDNFQNAGDNIASLGAEYFDSKLEAFFLADESSPYTHEQKEKLIAAHDALHQYESIFRAKEDGNIGRIILHTLCFAFSLANFGAGKTVSQGFTAQEGRRKPGKHDNAGLRAIKAEYKKKHSKFSNTQLWLAIKRELSDGNH